MTPGRDLRWSLLSLVALTLVSGLAVRAQTMSSIAADPFATIHTELARAIDFHLEQVGEASRRVAADAARPTPQAAAVALNPPANLFADISPKQVRTAQERLWALGVDAARIFAEEGVPLELLLVAGVESNYDPLALSSKGARGVWQFMPETAARFGLRVDKQRDERIHPVRSTRAAARYLRELYARFGDWLLALAAYNAGEAQVAAAVSRAGTRHFWQLAERGWLPEETRRYVPAVLARATLK